MGANKMQRIRTKYPGVWYLESGKNDRTYYITYKQYGKSVQKKVGKYSQGVREAYCKNIRDQIVAKIKLEDLGVGELFDKKPSYTLNELFDIYSEYSKHNKKSYKIDIWTYDKHVRSYLGNKVAHAIQPSDFEKLKQKKTNEGYQPQTVKHIIGLCRQIYNYAIKNQMYKNLENPISKKVSMPQIDNSRKAFLSKEEAKELLLTLKQESNKTAYYITVFSLMTGARIGEIFDLRWSDVNFTSNTIYFKKNKNGNDRHIFINSMLSECLDDLKELKTHSNSFVIPNSVGNKLLRMPDVFQASVEKIRPGNQSADAKNKIVAHSLRHTHASWLAMDGLDIIQIKEQLGHKTLDMTLRYAHLIPSKRHKATEAISML